MTGFRLRLRNVGGRGEETAACGNGCASIDRHAQEAMTHWCTALRLNGQRETAQLIEETFKKSGFDAAVRTLGEKQLQDLDGKRARGEYVAAANYVFANIWRANIDEAFKWLPKMVEEPN